MGKSLINNSVPQSLCLVLTINRDGKKKLQICFVNQLFNFFYFSRWFYWFELRDVRNDILVCQMLNRERHLEESIDTTTGS